MEDQLDERSRAHLETPKFQDHIVEEVSKKERAKVHVEARVLIEQQHAQLESIFKRLGQLGHIVRESTGRQTTESLKDSSTAVFRDICTAPSTPRGDVPPDPLRAIHGAASHRSGACKTVGLR